MKFIQLPIYCLMILSAIISGCTAEKPSAEELLKDPDKQKEIFSAIIGDSGQIKQFENYEAEHRKKMNALKSDTATFKIMLGNVMGVVEKDSFMCDLLCRHMMENKQINETMEKMRDKSKEQKK